MKIQVSSKLILAFHPNNKAKDTHKCESLALLLSLNYHVRSDYFKCRNSVVNSFIDTLKALKNQGFFDFRQGLPWHMNSIFTIFKNSNLCDLIPSYAVFLLISRTF